MKKKTTKPKGRFQDRIGKTGSFLVCVFAVIFMLISITGVGSLDKSIDMILKHPFTVTMEVNNATNTVSEMRMRMEQLINYSMPADFEIAQRAISGLEPALEKSLDSIETNYLGTDGAAQRLKDTGAQIIDAQEALLANPENVNNNSRIERDMAENVSVLYDSFMEESDGIVSYEQKVINDFNNESSSLTRNNTVLVVLLTAVIILVSVYFRYAVGKKNQEIYYRENLFSQLSDKIDDVIFIVDMEKGKFEFISPNSARILGIDQAAFVENENILYSYMDEDSVMRIREAFLNGEMGNNAELEIKLNHPKDGSERWMMMRAYPIMADGILQRYIVSITDVTESRRTRQILTDSLVASRRINEAEKAFLSRMSHEIRTPMNTIIGMTTIAANALDNKEKVADCLYKIAYSSRHLLGIINDVLDMSAIESGKLVMKNDPFDFGEMIEEIASLYHTQCESQGKSFDLKLVGVAEEKLIGDERKLNQILLNLLSNAVKFTPDGGHVLLSIRQRPVREGKVHMTFTVKDTGIGMDEAFLNRVFEPFEQGENIAGKYGGSGLGLAITKNMIGLMGGDISVQSKQGEGTTFSVEISLQVDDTGEKKEEGNDLRDLHVLVVDDDEDTCEHVAILLERMGIRTQWVLSGAAAAEQVEAAQHGKDAFDICLIDWKMPGMDGIETTRKIREITGKDSPVIIISAYDWQSIEKDARAAGANAFISKPMLQSSIYNVLLFVIGKRDFCHEKKDKDGETFDFSNKRILLVEDNEMNMEIVTELLAPTGIAIETAINGREAVEQFNSSPQGHYDAILMDVQMPVMDGYQATREIRAEERADAAEIPIIAMTANAFSEDVAASLATGMNDHIAKPIDIVAMNRTLFKFFSRKKK